MRKHLNTLYVTTQGSYLSKDGANVVVSVEGEERARVPVHQLGGVTSFGRVSMSPALMGSLAEAGVGVTYLSEAGRFLARVEGPVSGNVLLRRAQHRASDDPERRAALARSIVIGKAVNQRAVVRRALRDHRGTMPPEAAASLDAAERRLTDIARRALKPGDTDWLRGLEGEAGRVYFGAFDAMIRADDPALRFAVRSRRPPMDPVNALLSFLYALLAGDCRSALEGVGLDPQIGFLHADRPGRPSLALDLMEEFRPWFADRLALSLLNRRQLNARDFATAETGAVRLTEEGRKAVLIAYQERKRDELRHDFLGEKATVGLLWHLQARLLARHLRGDLDGYPAFVWK